MLVGKGRHLALQRRVHRHRGRTSRRSAAPRCARSAAPLLAPAACWSSAAALYGCAKALNHTFCCGTAAGTLRGQSNNRPQREPSVGSGGRSLARHEPTNGFVGSPARHEQRLQRARETRSGRAASRLAATGFLPSGPALRCESFRNERYTKGGQAWLGWAAPRRGAAAAARLATVWRTSAGRVVGRVVGGHPALQHVLD